MTNRFNETFLFAHEQNVSQQTGEKKTQQNE